MLLCSMLATALYARTCCAQRGAAPQQPHTSIAARHLHIVSSAGYCPAFWVKVRMLAYPAVQSHLATMWPVAFGGLAHVTVGLIATFTSIACVVAADVGAYFVGATACLVRQCLH